MIGLWEEVKRGRGRVLLLSGDPGIGKSRLLREFQERIKGEPYTRLESRCLPYYKNSALYPVIDLLKRLFGFKGEASSQEKIIRIEGVIREYGFSIQEVLPLFASILSLPLSDRYTPVNLAPEKQRQRTLEALSDWLIKEAQRQPVLIILEDLHWVDPSTIEFLSLLIEREPNHRILTALTFRPEFNPPWAVNSHITNLTLSRLAQEDVKVIIESVAGGKALSAEMLNQIIDKTDGVPLFVEELTKMVIESGFIIEDNQYKPTGSLPSLTIPATLQDSLMARLDRLAPVKEVAQLGATLGREFTYELLHAVSSLD